MKIKNNKIILYILIFLSFIIFSSISDCILYHTNILFNVSGIQFRDIQFHLKRVMELKDLLQHNNVLNPSAYNYFHGSAVMDMYPYYSLIPLVIIFLITSSYIKSYYILFGLIIFFSLIISYFSSYTFNKSKIISYLFSVIYSLSLPFVFDYFYDVDLGITTSLVFLPITIFGFLNIIYNHKNYLELSLGLFLMLLCQIPDSIIIVLTLIIWTLIDIKHINKQIIFNLFKSLLLFCFLSSIVWVPIVKVVLFNKINTPGVLSIPIQESNITSIVKNTGILSLVIIIISLIIFKKLNRCYKQMLLISISIIILSSKIIPIDCMTSIGIFKLINKFQFTARFLIIPNILLCYLFSYILYKFNNSTNNLIKNSVIIITVIIISQLFSQVYLLHSLSNIHYTNGYNKVRLIKSKGYSYVTRKKWIKYLCNGYTNNRDYYPKSSNPMFYRVSNNEAIYGNNKIIKFKHIGYDDFSFINRNKINNLSLPIVYYNESQLNIHLDNRLIRYHVNKNNLIVINNVSKGKHKLHITYVPNIYLLMLEIGLLLSGILWIILYIIHNTLIKHHVLML